MFYLHRTFEINYDEKMLRFDKIDSFYVYRTPRVFCNKSTCFRFRA